MPKRIPISLIIVVFIVSLSVVVNWVRERRQVQGTARIAASGQSEMFRHEEDARESVNEQKANDCDEWAHMSFRQKQANYRTDPKRWDRCLCEGEGCELDRVYLTGKSRALK
ncbi:MAG TPA: hypothetical protein VMT71_10885 [Syntrophorhabdales bacterium]|nr:hypothetical protein [Syntrophorhabdales bacterium]